jgi:hypothetical protein
MRSVTMSNPGLRAGRSVMAHEARRPKSSRYNRGSNSIFGTSIIGACGSTSRYWSKPFSKYCASATHFRPDIEGAVRRIRNAGFCAIGWHGCAIAVRWPAKRAPGEQILAANGFHWAPLGLFGRFPRAVRRALNSQERIDGPAAPSVKCVIFKAFNLRWQFWHTRK